MSAYDSLMMSNPSSMDKYFDTLNVIAAVSGYNLTSMPVIAAYTFYDVFVSQVSIKYLMPTRTVA